MTNTINVLVTTAVAMELVWMLPRTQTLSSNMAVFHKTPASLVRISTPGRLIYKCNTRAAFSTHCYSPHSGQCHHDLWQTPARQNNDLASPLFNSRASPPSAFQQRKNKILPSLELSGLLDLRRGSDCQPRPAKVLGGCRGRML